MTVIARAATLRDTLGLKEVPQNGIAWHALILEGLPYRSLGSTAKAFGASEKVLAALLGLAPRTLAARKRVKRMTAQESDFLYALSRAFVRLAVVRGAQGAAGFLLNAQPELKGAIPAELLRTRLGTEYVMNLIERERAAWAAKNESARIAAEEDDAEAAEDEED